MLERIIEQRKTTTDVDARDEASQRPSGAQPGNKNAAKEKETNDHNMNNRSRPWGTSQAQALRQLRHKRPDLHQKVLAGELSPHAAAVMAGFRHRTITVRDRR
jgi:hypothetical protein